MKKIIASILAVVLIITTMSVGFISSAANKIAPGGMINNFDSLNYGGTTENFWTVVNFPTVISIDSSVKSQGSASLKVAGNTGNSGIDSIDHLFRAIYNTPLDLSGVDGFTFDLYTPTAFNNANATIEVRFVSGATGSTPDGYNFRLPIGQLNAGQWKTFTINKSAPTYTAPGMDWSNINCVIFCIRNPDNVTEPNMYFDNLKAKKKSADPNMLNNFDTANFDGATEIIWTVPNFPTETAIDTTIKSEGTGSFKVIGNAGNSGTDDIDHLFRTIYNTPMNLSNMKSFSFDLYATAAFENANATIEVRFVTGATADSGTPDGYNFRFPMGALSAGQWKTYTINTTDHTYNKPGTTWANINCVIFCIRNPGNVTEPDMYFDNFRKSTSASSGSGTSSTTPSPTFPPISASNNVIHDFDSTTFGGKTEHFVTHGVYATTFAIDNNIKANGSGSLRINKDREESFVADNMDAMIQINYNYQMDLSDAQSISFDMYFDQAFSADGEIHIRFATTSGNASGNQDGYFHKITNLQNYTAGTWHKITINKRTGFAAPAGVNCDWTKIDRVFIVFKNTNNIAEPNMYFDNLVANYAAGSSSSSTPSSSTTSSTPVVTAPEEMVHDFDSQNFGGKTQNIVTYGVYPTTFAIDNSIKSQGTGSLKLNKDRESSFAVDNMDAMIQINYNNRMDLSSAASISFDFYFSSAFSADGEIHFRFVTTHENSEGNQDGYYYKLTGLQKYEAGKWHTINIKRRTGFAAALGVTNDWSKVDRIFIIFKNTNNIAEPDMYFDNFRAIYPAPASSVVVSSEPVPSEVSSYVEPSSKEDPIESSQPAIQVMYGDVSGDKEVKSTDALLALQYSVGKIQLSEAEVLAADVTGDGEVKSTDALLILQYAVGKITSFPAEELNPMPSVPESSIPEPSVPVSSETVESREPTVSIPSTTLDNDAYSTNNPDNSDRSFVLTGKGLEAKKAYCISASLANSSYDIRRYITSLQGLVNRDFGRDGMHESIIYIMNDNVEDGFWYNQMIVEGSVYEGFEKVNVRNWDTFVTTFAAQMKQCGIVLWDGNVPATANVAATICGVDGYLPVLKGSELHQTLLDLGIEVKIDLGGMFTGKGTIPGTSIASTGSAKNDAYRWALEKYMDRCSDTYIAYTLDGAQVSPNHELYNHKNKDKHCIQNHDYLIARRAFFVDLSHRNDRAANDDPNQRVGLDRETLLMIFQRRYDRANGRFGQILGFPPWWIKYIYGTGDGEAVGNEWAFSELVTCFNLAKEADASEPSSMSNGSAYYKYVYLTKNFKNNDSTDNRSYNSGVHYFTFYVGDYDSSAWLRKYVRLYWKPGSDDARGQIPLNWAFNPNLSDRVPNVFDYIGKNMTSKDFLIAGDSGAGYVVPSALTKGKYLGQSQYTRQNPSAGNAWITYCQKYYSRFEMDITGFLLNSSNSLTTTEFDIYNQISGYGGFHIDTNHKMTSRNGVPYVIMRTGYDSVSDMYSWMTGTMSGYNFSVYRSICDSPSIIKGVIDEFTSYCAQRGRNVQYVDVYTFFRLAKSSGQLTAR